jgi:hypothetical protein
MMMQLNGYKGNDMSLGGSSSSSQQLDPAMRDAYLGNVNRATTVAESLGPRQFAQFNPDQQAAFGIGRQFADPNSEAFRGARQAFGVADRAANYQPNQVADRPFEAALANSQGYDAAQTQGTGYQAAQTNAAQLDRAAVRDVTAERIAAERIAAERLSGANVASDALRQIAPQARANIRDIKAGSSLNQDMQKYMNPYTQAVTDQSLKDLERSRQLQQQQTSAQATGAKAFGGSRQGVAEAETNRAYGENASRLVAQQNAEAFRNAQQASEADLSRSMTAQQLNQAQDAATTQQSLALSGQLGLANQQAALEAARANQSTGLSAAQSNQSTGLQANLANQSMDFNVGQLNTQNRQQSNLANQAASNQSGQFNAAAQNTASLANQGATNQARQFTSGAANTTSLANQGARNQVGLQNAQNFLQANLANQGAGLTANQQRLNASGQLANIAGQGQQMGLTGANALAQQGLLQQGFSQQQIDAIRNLPLEQQQIINQALGINPGGGSGQQQTSSSGQGLFGLFR